MKSRTRKNYLCGLSLLICAAVLLGLSCGGGTEPIVIFISNLSDPPSIAIPLSIADVTNVVEIRVGMSVNAPMVVAVADRAGNILAVFHTSPPFPATTYRKLWPGRVLG